MHKGIRHVVSFSMLSLPFVGDEAAPVARLAREVCVQSSGELLLRGTPPATAQAEQHARLIWILLNEMLHACLWCKRITATAGVDWH